MRKIIVIGSGYSGSGAILEYLVGRPDIANPFHGKEFRLIQDPDGLMDLYVSCKHNFTVQGTSAAMNRFIVFAERLHRHGMIKNIDVISRFISEITAVEYGAAPYCERLKMNYLQRHFYNYQEKWAHSKGRKPELVRMRIPVAEDGFIAASQKLIDGVIDDAADKKITENMCGINHGGSFWRPASSTAFYGDRKAVIVTRDARDIYSEVSVIGRAYPGRDPALFCAWYRMIMENIAKNEWVHPDVIHVVFEEFVRNYPASAAELSKRIGAEQNTSSTYSPARSMVNIGKFKNLLTREETRCIEQNLREYCYL